MILSEAHRFLFVKGVKVGGTSVEIALSTVCGPEDIVTPITPIDELKRLETGAGARNYSNDRAAERTLPGGVTEDSRIGSRNVRNGPGDLFQSHVTSRHSSTAT